MWGAPQQPMGGMPGYGQPPPQQQQQCPHNPPCTPQNNGPCWRAFQQGMSATAGMMGACMAGNVAGMMGAMGAACDAAAQGAMGCYAADMQRQQQMGGMPPPGYGQQPPMPGYPGQQPPPMMPGGGYPGGGYPGQQPMMPGGYPPAGGYPGMQPQCVPVPVPVPVPQPMPMPMPGSGQRASCHETGCKHFMKDVVLPHTHDFSCNQVSCSNFMKHGCPHHSFRSVQTAP